MEHTPKKVLTEAAEYIQTQIDRASEELGNLQNRVQKTLILRDQLLTERQEIERALRG